MGGDLGLGMVGDIELEYIYSINFLLGDYCRSYLWFKCVFVMVLGFWVIFRLCGGLDICF